MLAVHNAPNEVAEISYQLTKNRNKKYRRRSSVNFVAIALLRNINTQTRYARTFWESGIKRLADIYLSTTEKMVIRAAFIVLV